MSPFYLDSCSRFFKRDSQANADAALFLNPSTAFARRRPRSAAISSPLHGLFTLTKTTEIVVFALRGTTRFFFFLSLFVQPDATKVTGSWESTAIAFRAF